MATRKETIRFEGDGNLDKTLKTLAKSADGLAESLDKTAKNAEEASKKSESLGTKTAKLALGFNQIQQAAGAIGGTLSDLVQKYAELDAASGRLANSFTKAGASADDMAKAEALATEMARRGQASRLDSINSLRLLTDASGSATQAIDDYRLAVDIASQTGKSASEASDILAKVRNGEVEALKDLRGLNKDLAADLGKIEDSTLRTEVALQFLSESYEGAAEANAGLIDRQAAFKLSLEDLESAAGNVAGAIGEGAVGLVGSFGKLIGVIKEGADPVATLSGAFNNFGSAIREVVQPMQDLVEAGGLFGAVLSGRSFAEILSDADSARARSAAASKKNKAAIEEETKSVEKQTSATDKLIKTLAEQEKKKADEAAKAPKKIASKKRTEKVDDTEEKDRAAEEAEKARAAKDAEKAREKEELDREKQITELERLDALEREIELRDTLAQLEMDGREFDAERLRIQRSSMTEKEKELALGAVDVAQQQHAVDLIRQQAEAQLAKVDAYAGIATGLANLAGLEQEAVIAQAALDGAKATYLAGIEFGLGNFIGAASLGVAAAQAFALAGTSAAGLGGGGGAGAKGGGGKSSPGAASAGAKSVGQQARETRGINESRGPSTSIFNLNYRGLTRPTPREAREIKTSLMIDERSRA